MGLFFYLKEKLAQEKDIPTPLIEVLEHQWCDFYLFPCLSYLLESECLKHEACYSNSSFPTRLSGVQLSKHVVCDGMNERTCSVLT